MATAILPLNEFLASEAEWKAVEAEQWGTFLTGKNTPSYRNVAHPDSYGSHLPLRSELHSLSSLSKTSKAERKQLAERPVMVRQDAAVLNAALASLHCSAFIDGQRLEPGDARAAHYNRKDELQAREIDKAFNAIAKRRESVRARAAELSFNFATVK